MAKLLLVFVLLSGEKGGGKDSLEERQDGKQWGMGGDLEREEYTMLWVIFCLILVLFRWIRRGKLNRECKGKSSQNLFQFTLHLLFIISMCAQREHLTMKYKKNNGITICKHHFCFCAVLSQWQIVPVAFLEFPLFSCQYLLLEPTFPLLSFCAQLSFPYIFLLCPIHNFHT